MGFVHEAKVSWEITSTREQLVEPRHQRHRVRHHRVHHKHHRNEDGRTLWVPADGRHTLNGNDLGRSPALGVLRPFGHPRASAPRPPAQLSKNLRLTSVLRASRNVRDSITGTDGRHRLAPSRWSPSHRVCSDLFQETAREVHPCRAYLIAGSRQDAAGRNFRGCLRRADAARGRK